MSEFLKHFAKRLTNLSAANRMLFLPRLSAGRHEDFFNLSHLERRSSFELLSDLVRERPVKICPVHDPRMESANQSSTRLRQLTRNVQAVFQETGAQDLHLAFLFVRGTFSNGTPVRAPLILIPVQLSVMDGHWVLCITAESRPALNKSFLYAYSHHQSMGSGEALPDDLFDEAESVQDFKTALLDSFQKAGIDVNFQPDYFQDHITQFQSYKRIEFSKEHGNGTGILRVFPEAVLGIFPQSDSYLAPDYRSMIESGKYQTSNDFFQSLGCPEPMAEPAESRLVCAFPADPWQEQAIRKIKRGFSIVVEGPPGTGKSQLICNLVADALAAKKSVLVVSQKKAALDVVWDRLQQADLQSFTARVHDFRADRKTVVESIASQIQKLEDYRQLNRSVDAIQLERQFQKSSNRIDQIVEQLEEFRTALADEQVCGMSIKEMYLHADAKIPVISLRNELHLLRMDQSDDLERKIHVLATLRQVIEKEAPSWRQRVSFSEMDQTDLKRLIKLLESFHHDMEELTSPIVSLSSVKPDFLQLQSLSADNEKIESLSSLLVPDEFGYLQRLFEHLSEEASDLWLANLQRMVESCFQGEGVESTLAHDQLGLAQQMLSRSVSAHKNIFSRLWWNIFSKDKFLIGRLMVVYGLRGLAGLHTLEKKLDNRLNLEHLLSKLHEQNWTFRIPGGYDADRIRHWFEATRRALRIRDTIVSSRILPQLFSHSIGAGDAERFLECASILQTQIKKFDKLQQKVLRYLTLRQVEELSADPDVMSQWSSELKAQFDRMQATDRIMEGFQDWEKGILERLEEAVPDQSPDNMVEVLHNSMLTAWIHYLEARSPVLRMIHSGELELMEIELQDLDLQKRKLGSKMVLQNPKNHHLSIFVIFCDHRRHFVKIEVVVGCIPVRILRM